MYIYARYTIFVLIRSTQQKITNSDLSDTAVYGIIFQI